MEGFDGRGLVLYLNNSAFLKNSVSLPEKKSHT